MLTMLLSLTLGVCVFAATRFGAGFHNGWAIACTLTAFCAGCPTLQAPCGKPLRQICQTLPGGPEKCLTRAGKSTLPLQLLLAGPIARGIFRAAFRREDAQRS